METFGERLKFLIKKSDFKTIKRFSEEIKVSEVTISRIVTNKNNPSFDVIVACLNLFPHQEVLWLMTGKEHQTELELENKQLKEKVGFYERKLRSVAKFSSNRTSPRLPFPEYSLQNSAVLL